MPSLSSLKSQLRQIEKQIDSELKTDVLAERLWLGLSTREEVIALELRPERKTGLPRPNASTLSLKLLDVVTFPILLQAKRMVPTGDHSYCWKTKDWSVDEFNEFFRWFDSREPDLFDLPDDLADRYRDQLRFASQAWLGDRIVSRWFLDRAALGVSLQDSLMFVSQPENSEEILPEFELIASGFMP